MAASNNGDNATQASAPAAADAENTHDNGEQNDNGGSSTPTAKIARPGTQLGSEAPARKSSVTFSTPPPPHQLHAASSPSSSSSSSSPSSAAKMAHQRRHSEESPHGGSRTLPSERRHAGRDHGDDDEEDEESEPDRGEGEEEEEQEEEQSLSPQASFQRRHSGARRRRRPGSGAQGPAGGARGDGGGGPGGWWKGFLGRYGSVELDNKGSVARDHLALERTFLAWLRTSLAFASIGIAIIQLFRLNTSFTGREYDSEEGAIRLRQLGKPIGVTFLGISIVVLFVGFHRYFESQHWIIRGKFPASRLSIFVVTVIAGMLIVGSLVVLLVVDPGGVRDRERRVLQTNTEKMPESLILLR
ncbi:MAG: hypothetical protein M1816_001773 [Peltula sp. TS41687]|nr:MAG: hypothetical protein M1816_001773 [Peltula sp. TS41687]